MEQDIAALQYQINRLNSQIQHQGGAPYAPQQETIATMSQKIKMQAEQIDQQLQLLANRKDENNALEARIAKLENSNRDIQKRVDTVSAENIELRQQIIAFHRTE